MSTMSQVFRHAVGVLSVLAFASCTRSPAQVAPARAASVAAPESAPSAPTPEVHSEAPFVVWIAGQPKLVAMSDMPRGWAKGEPSLVKEGQVLQVVRPLDLGAVPDSIQARLGESVTLMGARGNMCTARIGSPSALSRLIDEGPTATASHDARELAKNVWDSDVADHLLVYSLEIVRGDCEGALYAKTPSDTRVWAAADAPSGAQDDVARAAFRALPQAQAMIAASPASSEPAPLTVRMFDVDGDRFYFVSDGEESNCGEDHIGALFRADRGESPRELELVLASPDLAGDAVTLVRDRVSSEIRILYRDWQMRLPRGKEADTRTTTRVPFEGCGC